MKKLISITIFTFLTYILIYSQEVAPNKYYIEFTDKDNNAYSINNPEAFLSIRSLNRRANQDIEITSSDLPVTEAYLDSLKNHGVEIINISKWFNSALIYTEDVNKYNEILDLPFIKNTPNYLPFTNNSSSYRLPERLKSPANSLSCKDRDQLEEYEYGYSENQIKSINAHKLHQQGYRGNGMLIAVIDAGFENVENLTSLQHLHQANKIISTKEFLTGKNNPDYYDKNTHGTKVFSIIGALLQGELIGTAPEANFTLLVSEDSEYENYIEEINWISAAEYADSLGADVINVSLGYIFFDMGNYNHSYQTLDGKHAISSIAATHASSKGMIICVSMGNSGSSENHPWLGAPADAENILGVGAVRQDLNYASFSSKGPSADGRTKPDIVAIGHSTISQSPDNTINPGNGTSFSAPIIAGMAACLWQKHPDKNNLEIMDAIRKSGNLYNSPTELLGNGLPDFELASQILNGTASTNMSIDYNIDIFPNPFESSISIYLNDVDEEFLEIKITDLVGRLQYQNIRHSLNKNNNILINNLDILNPGVYIINIISETHNITRIITKQ